MAFAADMLFGFSPGKRNHDESKLRSHLAMCLEQGKLSFPLSFPQSTEIRKKSKQSLTLMDVYCKCRSPLFENDTDKNPVLYMMNVQFAKSGSMRNVKGYQIFILEMEVFFL